MGAPTAIFHISVFTLYVFVMYLLHVQNVKKGIMSQDKTVQTMALYSKRFLTNWTFALQAVYFLMCIIQHFLSFLSASRIKDKLSSYSDYLFTSITTPMALMVSIIFWSIFTIDRELIFPKALDEVMPVWVNHCIHTFNSALAIIDMYLVNHKFSSWTKALKGILIYLLMYSICVFGTYFQTGVWIYPILKELDWPQRILFSVCVLILAAVSYGLTKLIQRILWEDAVPEKPKKSGKSKKKEK